MGWGARVRWEREGVGWEAVGSAGEGLEEGGSVTEVPAGEAGEGWAAEEGKALRLFRPSAASTSAQYRAGTSKFTACGCQTGHRT